MALSALLVLMSVLAVVPEPSQAWSPGVCVCNCCAQCNDVHLAGSFHVGLIAAALQRRHTGLNLTLLQRADRSLNELHYEQLWQEAAKRVSCL